PEQFFGRARPTDDGFLLGEIWTDKALASTLHRIERCRIWAPGDTVPASRRVADERRDLREAELPGGGLSLKVIRVDASPACTSRELRIFSQPAGADQPAQFEEGV